MKCSQNFSLNVFILAGSYTSYYCYLPLHVVFQVWWNTVTELQLPSLKINILAAPCCSIFEGAQVCCPHSSNCRRSLCSDRVLFHYHYLIMRMPPWLERGRDRVWKRWMEATDPREFRKTFCSFQFPVDYAFYLFDLLYGNFILYMKISKYSKLLYFVLQRPSSDNNTQILLGRPLLNISLGENHPQRQGMGHMTSSHLFIIILYSHIL